MYKQKLSPEESLKRIKLMMEYDSSKTLTENSSLIAEESSIISEQSCPNSMTYADLKDKAIEAGDIVKKMGAVFVRMGYGEERAQELFTLVKSLVGKNVVDDITGECTDAIQKFKDTFKATGSKGWFEGGFDLEKRLRDYIKNYYSDDEEVKRYLNGTLSLLQKTAPQKTTTPPTNTTQSGYTPKQQHINNMYCSLKNGIITAGGRYNGKKWEEYTKAVRNITQEEIEVAKKSCGKTDSSGRSGSRSGGYAIPTDLQQSGGVKAFQDWMVSKNLGSELGKFGADGKFGRFTSAAWNKYKNQYLNKSTTTGEEGFDGGGATSTEEQPD